MRFWQGFTEFLEAFFGVGAVVGVENGSEVRGDLGFEVGFGDVLLGVLLEVELATRCHGVPFNAVLRALWRLR